MRRLFGLAVLLAGCLKPSAHTCSQGWTCPGGLDCVDPPTFCSSPNEAHVCSGAADFTACSTASVAAGYCVGGACQACVVDEAACPAATWTQMTYTGADLTSVFVRAPGSAIAVGAGSVATWDGHAWSALDVASPDVLRSVWVPPEGGDAWIASSPTIYRWDGATLAALNMPAQAMSAIWASSQSDVWAAGALDTIVHDAAGTFTSMQLGSASPHTLLGVGGSSATDVYVVGTAATVAHLAGTTWTTQTLPTDVVGALRAVWADAPNDVFVVGNASTLLHFDGTSWTHSAAAADVTAAAWVLRAVWGSGPSNVYAVGNDVGGATGAILHFDGQMWTTMLTMPSPLTSIGGSGPHEVIAVGANQTVLRFTAP